MSLVTIPVRFRLRAGTAAALASLNETPYAREMVFTTDGYNIKVGDGATTFNSLRWLLPPFAAGAGADTITATFTAKPVLFDGLHVYVRAAAANTGAVTFNPNSLGALAVTKQGGTVLAAGDIAGAGHELILRYVSSVPRWELLNPKAATGAGTGDVVGPASAVDNRVAFFDGTSGKLIKDSGLTLSGTNTGDQTTIVGITGTLSEFNAALTGADFATGGGTVTGASSGTNTGDQTTVPALAMAVAQAAHGFSVGHAIQLTASGWAVADRDAGATVCDAVVSAVADVNNFTACLGGPVTLTTGQWDAVTGDTGGLTKGDYYWLSSTAGGLTRTQPTSGIVQGMGVADSTTALIVRIGEAIEISTLDAELAAIAGLTSAADKVPYFTGSGTAALADFTAAGRALVDDASASAQRTTLGIGLGDAQAWTAAHSWSGLTHRNQIINTTTQTSVGQSHGGLMLQAVTMNTTNKYTAGLLFGSSDADFTTTNPKLGAAIVGYATENFTADTAGGMGLEFFGVGNAPGVTPTPTSLGTWTVASGLSCTLASATVATTQAAGDNSTKVATTAYVRTAASHSSYRTIIDRTGSHTAARTASKYAIPQDQPCAITGVGTLYNPGVFYYDPADHPTLDGLAPKLRIRAQVYCNDTAPTGTYIIGMYPVTRPATSGGTGVCIFTIGTVIAGSETTTVNAPAADSSTQVVGSDFAAPTAGHYVIGFVQTGTVAALAHMHFSAQLQMRNN